MTDILAHRVRSQRDRHIRGRIWQETQFRLPSRYQPGLPDRYTVTVTEEEMLLSKEEVSPVPHHPALGKLILVYHTYSPALTDPPDCDLEFPVSDGFNGRVLHDLVAHHQGAWDVLRPRNVMPGEVDGSVGRKPHLRVIPGHNEFVRHRLLHVREELIAVGPKVNEVIFTISSCSFMAILPAGWLIARARSAMLRPLVE